jgi:uncharacterized SAM-binding protein YcdF (DUF218 family)
MDIFFLLSKVLTIFLFPLPMILLLGFVLSFFLKNKTDKWIMRVPLLLLWFFSNNFISQKLIRSLEDEFPPVKIESIESADAIVVLGGAVNPFTYYPEKVELLSSADRMTDTIILYKNKKANLVLFTGGSGLLFQQDLKEATFAEKFFLDLGIPKSSIIFEENSRNTAENAIESAKILEHLQLKKIILVTSAFHMKRSLGVFSKQGLDIIVYPTDYKSLREETNWETIVPSSGFLEGSTMAIKEWIGILVYKLKGFM